MTPLLIGATVLQLVIILWLLARSLLARSWDLLSWRNLFLVGYLHFVVLSGYFTVVSGIGALRKSAVTPYAIGLYAVLSIVFLLVFLGTCGWAVRRPNLARIFPRLELPITSPSITWSVVILLGLSFLFAVAPLPSYIKLLGLQFRSGMATTAVGLATFYLLARRFNPAAWTLLVGSLGLAFVISIIGGSGRRDAVAALVAVPWMWYYMSLRYRSTPRIVLIIGGLVVAGVLFITVYGAVRHKGFRGEQGPDVATRASQIQQILQDPTISTEVVESMLYTDTAGNTMFCFNTYPESHAYRPGHALSWVLLNPIPRAIMPSKPEALGIILKAQMGQQANLGPGILGQAWTEGGFMPVIIFAVFFGLYYGAVDNAIRLRAWNPFFVAVAGCASGNVLALPRGDVALFLIEILAATISSATALAIINVLVSPIARAFPPLSVPVPGTEGPETHDHAADEEPDQNGEDAAQTHADHGVDALSRRAG